MTYKWYKLFNQSEWVATGLVSRTITVILEDLGQKEVLLTKGNEVGFVIEDTFLVVNMASKNPFWRDGWGVFLDEDANVWLGKEVA